MLSTTGVELQSGPGGKGKRRFKLNVRMKLKNGQVQSLGRQLRRM